MAIPAVPLWAVIALVVLAVLFGPVFSAAEVSHLSVRLDSEQFRVANAFRMISIQAAQVGGFALGGLIVAVLAPRTALLLDAATFAVSAILVGSVDRDVRGPQRRPGLELPAEDGASAFTGLWSDRRLRALVALSLLAGFFVVPEGLAVPFGRSVGASTANIGLLLAAGAMGGATGAALLVRRVPTERRGIVAKWMAVGCGIPLVLSGLAPSWPVAALCWGVSGLLAAYIVETSTIVIQAIPDARRAHLVGVVGSLLLGVQGVGLVAFGALAELSTPATSIATAGAVGSILAAALVAGPLQERAEIDASPNRDSSHR